MTASAFHPAYRHVTQALVGIRKKAGLTQWQLAALLNRERSFISRIESGERRLDLLEFFWICNACKTSRKQGPTPLASSWHRPATGRKR